jgi:biopolymer transport protein ExbD
MARKTPGINTGSMADISFLLLTFFLLTSSINTEQGIPRKLPPPSKVIVDTPTKERNVLQIVVNFKNEISANGSIIQISELKEKALEFLENPNNLGTLPEKEHKSINYIGDFMVSKGVISLKNDQSTSYDIYVQVQNELEAAYTELRNKVSGQYFGKKYKTLDTSVQNAIKVAIPMQISEAKSNDFSKQP